VKSGCYDSLVALVLFCKTVNGSVPESEEQVLAACETALRLAPAEYLPDLPVSTSLLGVQDWYPFEHAAWPIGESIRRAFSHHPHLKKRTTLISKVAEVATCRNLRRGRQSFVMALGFVGAQQFAKRLVPFLRDSDVDGQVLDTLLKMKAGGYAQAVAPLAHSDKAWIRRLAKKYLERFG